MSHTNYGGSDASTGQQVVDYEAFAELGMNKFTADEFVAAGIRDAVTAKAWKDVKIYGDQAADFVESDVTDPAEAAQYLAEGIHGEYIATLHGYGISGRDVVRQWHALVPGSYDVYTFLSRDVDLETAKLWGEHHLDGFDMEMYHSIGIDDPNEAAEWSELVGVENAVKLVPAGLTDVNEAHRAYRTPSLSTDSIVHFLAMGITDPDRMAMCARKGLEGEELADLASRGVLSTVLKDLKLPPLERLQNPESETKQVSFRRRSATAGDGWGMG